MHYRRHPEETHRCLWIIVSSVLVLLIYTPSVVQGTESPPLSNKHDAIHLPAQQGSLNDPLFMTQPRSQSQAPVVDGRTVFAQSRRGDSSYSSTWLRRHLGTKGPYPHEDRPIGRLSDVPEGYDLVQLHLLNRHGTRYPSIKKSKLYVVATEKFKSAASIPGMEWLKNWNSGTRYPVNRGDLLAAKGDSDLYQIGRRFRIRYSELLDQFPYNANNFQLTSSAKPRCTQSGSAFAAGFFEGRYTNDPGMDKQGAPYKLPSLQPGLDREIAIKSACPKWHEQIDDRPEFTLRQRDLFEPRFLPALAAQISQALGSSVNVTTADVSSIYQLCGFEISIYNEDQTWCRLLRPSVLDPSHKRVDDRVHFLNLETLEDMDDFYTHGPGIPFNRNLGCVFGTTLMDSIQLALNNTGAIQEQGEDDEDGSYVHHGVFKFGHSETLMFVSTFLGLYHQQGIALRANMTAKELADREFKTSRFAPFAGNMVFEVYRPKRQGSSSLKRRADDTSTPPQGSPVVAATPHGLVRMLVNERPMLIPGCNGRMFCEWATFKGVLKKAGAGVACDALRKHIERHHTITEVLVGSFGAVAVPEFEESKPKLRFKTAEGQIVVEVLAEEDQSASTLPQEYPTTTEVEDEVFVDESFRCSFSPESAALQDTGESFTSLPLPEMADDSGQSGPPSPEPLPVVTKRMFTPSEVLVSRSTETGIVGIEIKLRMTGRDLGLRDVPINSPPESLLSLLADSPYSKVLCGTTWEEFPKGLRLPQKWDDIISGCWIEKPLLRYATAALFAGCVLYNPHDRNAVLCLVAESYGRGRDIDIHCEKPVIVGDSVSSISQPSTSGLYSHATVCRIQHNKSDHRLVLGCKFFNVLFTQVWQLRKDADSKRAFSAGCCSSAFPLFGRRDVRVFIDKRSLDLASDIASGIYTPRFEVDNLRQIRSHLCSEHSYQMGRASSYLISNMVSAKVASIFTLVTVSMGSGHDCLVSSFLSRIAKEVNAKGRKAVLRNELVSDLLHEVKADKKYGDTVRGILKLFKDNDEISILSNDRPAGLEELLNSLAGSVSLKLKNCNDKVVEPQLTQEMSSLSW
ncbi:PHOsphatase [Podila humilis]|nr:PHOsphatase [Podila humilis]